MIIKRLWSEHPPGADATELLGLPRGADGLVDISADRWDDSVILRDLAFTSVRLAKVELGVRFNHCTFDRCTLGDIRLEETLFGTGCRWRDCRFESITATDLASPMNLFDRCDFDGLCVRGYTPYQTLFRDCRFRNLTLQALRVDNVRNSKNVLPELSGYPQNLVFIDCTFERPSFINCYFNNVAFERCKVSLPAVKTCDFTGVAADKRWWQPSDQTDPFRTFLTEAVSQVEARLGRESQSYEILAAHLAEYSRNPAMGQQYPEGLAYVPNDEFKKVSKILDRLMSEYGLL